MKITKLSANTMDSRSIVAAGCCCNCNTCTCCWFLLDTVAAE
ncbi:hypothetical protein SAMN02745146_3009 [Hymenobacter daecheongensis DSM 21074]|uniref:Uncharacterized protein n=1 Tax=Hymenobacter daecheongensis DSM 21074 TaxID=1121955 RepID=A0A1M6IXM6_9BACT|nr:hypothetical protein [Hymenobacter daecheongensis]SHJ39176.1 hypothetical protein SAMN02745146_3009 [Hymenobacter daecheongensis DSM 21074]